jgi:hypothetical protein
MKTKEDAQHQELVTLNNSIQVGQTTLKALKDAIIKEQQKQSRFAQDEVDLRKDIAELGKRRVA